MLNRLRHLLLTVLALFSVFRGAAQSALPDFVCVGAVKHYWVDNNPSSTYTWKIGEDIQTSSAHEIFITWDKPPGKYTLTVQERSNDCLGAVQSIEVNVGPCDFIVPQPFVECVEPLKSVIYSIAINALIIDQPDYYTFSPLDTRLDIIGFDNSCKPKCSLTLHWRIDFSPAPDPSPPHNPVAKPPVSGTGQPSEITGNIQFPGDGFTFQDVVHTITYWIEDSAGNRSNEQQQRITIKPRPKIL